MIFTVVTVLELLAGHRFIWISFCSLQWCIPRDTNNASITTRSAQPASPSRPAPATWRTQHPTTLPRRHHTCSRCSGRLARSRESRRAWVSTCSPCLSSAPRRTCGTCRRTPRLSERWPPLLWLRRKAKASRRDRPGGGRLGPGWGRCPTTPSPTLRSCRRPTAWSCSAR